VCSSITMQIVTLLLLALAVCFASAGFDADIDKGIKKVGTHHFLAGCWGDKNMLQFYLILKESMEKCNALRPTFDIDLGFGGGDSNNFQLINRPVTLPGLINRPVTLPAPLSAGQTVPRMALGQSPNIPWKAVAAFALKQLQQGDPAGSSFFNRKKRALLTPTAADMSEFMVNLGEYTMAAKDTISNLTCVLARMRVLDSNLNINIDFLTRDMWSMLEEPVDEDFKAEYTKGMSACHAMAQSLPQAVLDQHPITKVFGRNLFYFKCSKKMEKRTCLFKTMYDWLEIWYGPITSAQLKEFGLPENKGEAAAITFKVLESVKSEAEKEIMKFFFEGYID
jgi:hypothetical protein